MNMRFLIAITVSLLFSEPRAFAEILFIDLNNADGEVAACENAAPGEVHVVGKSTVDAPRINAAVVEQQISALERAGRSIDTLVISGHDGSGHYFGGTADENEFWSGELEEILKRHPRFRSDLKVLALYGCYPTNVNAKQRFWLGPNPSVNFAIGFPVQAPTKENKSSQQLLGQFCAKEMRTAAANAATREELCEFYKNLPLLSSLNASICNQDAVASRLYGKQICYSDDELQTRCGDFDPDDAMKEMYDKYFAGQEPGFENPPHDGGSIYTGKVTTDLRKYYNQVHLWDHCYQQLKEDRGYNLPAPPEMIRLIFFDNLRANLNRLNRKQLDDFDYRMQQLGLSHLALGDLTDPSLSRGEIVRRLDQAVKQLGKMGRQGTAVRDPDTGAVTEARNVYTMAVMLKLTLADLKFKTQLKDGNVLECSHFTLVHPNQTRHPSRCILSYGQAISLNRSGQ